MYLFKSSIPLALLLVLGCDLKIDGDSEASTDFDGGTTGDPGHSEEGSASIDAPTSVSHGSGAPSSASDTLDPVESSTTYPGHTSDTDGPVETTSPTTSPGPTSDTEGPVETTDPTTSPGPTSDTESLATEGSVGTSCSDSGETATEGPSEPETGVCGWGAGGDEGGSQCLLAIFQCGDLPKLEMKCDTVSCVCLEGGVQIGSCDADAVCEDLDSVQHKGPSCCGFPAVSP